jgi:hypothetical protein
VSVTFAGLAALLDLTVAEATTIEVETQAGVVLLRVSDAVPAPGERAPGESRGGAIYLTGGAEFPLGSDTFEVLSVARPEIAGPLFLVPLTDVGGVRTYQAIFA